MSASCLHADSTRPILLATLAGALVSIVVCAGALQHLGTATSAAPSCDDDAALSLAFDVTPMTESLAFARSACDSNATAMPDDEAEALDRDSLTALTRAKERELRAAFVAAERAEPGTLDARAAAILASTGPVAEKVALLRALRDTAVPSTLHWLDVALHASSNAPDARAHLLPNFALEQMTELAVSDARARGSLQRIAFDSTELALELRRRAVAAYAAVCAPEQLNDLSAQLWRERDELSLAGALSALASRPDEPRVQSVLDAHHYTRSESSLDEAQSSN
jgi:hypothetical protein